MNRNGRPQLFRSVDNNRLLLLQTNTKTVKLVGIVRTTDFPALPRVKNNCPGSIFWREYLNWNCSTLDLRDRQSIGIMQ